MTKQLLRQYYKEAKNCDWEFEDEKTDTEYAITIDKDRKECIVSFQGSISLLDWLQNFSFWKKPYKHMDHLFFVHVGFLKKWKAVREDVIKQITPFNDQNYLIKIRGFSQGAAIALLMHETMWFMNIDCHTILFACPKVFSWINKKQLSKRFKHVSMINNVNDIVPKLPPFIPFGFLHYGNKLYIGVKKFTLRFKYEHNRYNELF